ncbi:hypothetical protein TIFTF001_010105 [Ficus carica]|uniref:Uncharacterized protein n=1 Tax=Ficus carica TaxID=3494 RepID=A0AA87ZXK7_FICCA|nr:hypothetical protein TIFTF001_010105 [Ficus carica]
MSSFLESQRQNLRNAILRLIEECRNMRQLKQIHTQIIKSPHIPQPDQTLLLSRLLFFCAISDSGSLSYATDIFRVIKNPNLHVYNIMIRAYASENYGRDKNRYSFKSFLLYKQMLCEGFVPNCLTFPFLLKECAVRVDSFAGSSINGQVIKFGFCGGRSKEALELFHEMQAASGDVMVRPDKITIASVLSACAQLGAIDHGKWVDSYLRRSGLECDVVIGTALVDMYGKCGSVERASKVFEEMPEKDILAYTTMISVLALHGFSKEAFDVYGEMEMSGVKPNHVTFVGLLTACSHAGLIDKGHWFLDVMKRVHSIEPQVYHYACMVDMLSRAGLFEEAERVIRGMPMKPDVFVWGALLAGCQMHGKVELGEKVAKYLINLEPLNHAFYVNLRDIYAKSGRFEDSRSITTLMKERGIKKEVVGCSMIEIDGVIHEFSVRGSPYVGMERIEQVLNVLNKEMNRKGLVGYDGNYGITMQA